ncbi:uncharacterized protein LOC144107119 [Amblyomma americanum]
MSGGPQLEDGASRHHHTAAVRPSPPAPTKTTAETTAEARSPDLVAAATQSHHNEGCKAATSPVAAAGDGAHDAGGPLVWLAILKVGLMADTAWCSGAIHDRARRLWLSFHRLQPPDGQLAQLAGEAAPPWEPLAATLWQSIAAVRAIWEQQPPAATKHTTLATATLFLWQAHWPPQALHELSKRAAGRRCCCSCHCYCHLLHRAHFFGKRDAAALLRALAADYEMPADKGPWCQMDFNLGVGQAKLLHALWTSGPCTATQCPCLGKPWSWEGAELLLPLMLSQGLSWAALVHAGSASCA